MISFASSTSETGQVFITGFVDGTVVLADDTNPNFPAIAAACAEVMAGTFDISEAEFALLFDIPKAIERAFARLSERVTVQGNEILFDGDPAQPALSKQILRFMDEGEDFEPLVNFMERIESNPEPHSREQAFAWLNNHDFTITADGNVVAYKGVSSDGAGGYCSGFSGRASVNDVVHNGRIPYAVGDFVTMPRSEVTHDPNSACHAGLHVGTYDYAQMYSGSGAMLKVIVDPRDIVSVPHDAAGQKIRVCRFVIDSIIQAPVTSAFDRVAATEPEDEAAFSNGDLVKCQYSGAYYGVGVVQSIDEDGEVWVMWDNLKYGPCCMDADELYLV